MHVRKTDKNQAEIIRAFREHGCSVQSLHRVGGGFPDLLVCNRRLNYLVEVKSKYGKLYENQVRWIDFWPSEVYVCRTTYDVTELVERWNSTHQK